MYISVKMKVNACSNNISPRVNAVATTAAQTIGFCLPGSFIMSISCSFFSVFQRTLPIYEYHRILFMNILCFICTTYMRCIIKYAYMYVFIIEFRERIVKENNKIHGEYRFFLYKLTMATTFHLDFIILR